MHEYELLLNFVLGLVLAPDSGRSWRFFMASRNLGVPASFSLAA